MGNWFIKDAPEEKAPPPKVAFVRPPAPPVSSFLVPNHSASFATPAAPPPAVFAAPAASAAAPTGPSPKVLKIVEAIRPHIDPNNAMFQLMDEMKSLEDVIPDPAKRRAKAIELLGKHGVTEAMIAAGKKDVERTIDAFLDDLDHQAAGARTTDVDNVVAQAEARRRSVADIDRQIADLQSQQTTLKGQAEEFDQQAKTQAADLDEFGRDITAARSYARVAFGV